MKKLKEEDQEQEEDLRTRESSHDTDADRGENG